MLQYEVRIPIRRYQGPPERSVEPDEGHYHHSTSRVSTREGPAIHGDNYEVSPVVMRALPAHSRFDGSHYEEVEEQAYEKVQSKQTSAWTPE